MTRKVLAVGMIWFLSSGCLPHLGSLSEKTNTIPPLTKNEAPLSTQTELEKPPSQEIPSSPGKPSPSSPAPPSLDPYLRGAKQR